MSTNALSLSWRTDAVQTALYTGGKVVLSKDCSTVVSWCSEFIVFWGAEDGQIKQKIEGDGFSTFALHPNGTELMTAGASSLLMQRWDLETGKITQQWKSHKFPVMEMDYDCSGTYVVSSSVDRMVKVWNAEKGFATHNFAGHATSVNMVRFNPAPHVYQVISSSLDGDLRLWDLKTNKGVQLEHNHMSAISSMAFSNHTDANSSQLLFTAGRDQIVTVWDLQQQSKLMTIPAFEELEGIVMIPSTFGWPDKDDMIKLHGDLYFCTAGSKGLLRIWSMKEKKEIYTHSLLGESDAKNVKTDNIKSVAHCFTGLMVDTVSEQFIAVTAEHNFQFYDTNTFNRTRSVVGYNDEIIALRCLKDNQHVVMATNSSEIRYVNMNNLGTTLISGHEDVVLGLDVSHSTKFMVTISKDLTVRMWDLETMLCVSICKGHTESISSCAFSALPERPNDFFALSGGRDRVLKKWNCAPLIQGKKKKPHTEQLSCISVIAHAKEINAIKVSPNNQYVATGSLDRSIIIWQSNDLTKVTELIGHRRGVWDLAFSPIDKVLASCSGDKTIKLWSLNDYTCLQTLQGHTSPVLSISFLKSGLQIMSAGADELIKLWNVKTKECMNTFDEPHTERIWSLALSPDNTRMVTGGADGQLVIWTDITVEESEEQIEFKKQQLLKTQQFDNLHRQKKYVEAALIALELQQPRRLYKLLVEMVEVKAQVDGKTSTRVLVERMNYEQLSLMFRCIREWNTNAKHCQIAQIILQHIFACYSPQNILDGCGEEISDIFKSLNNYSQRHFQRIDKLIEKCYLIDFQFAAINLFTDPNDTSNTMIDYKIMPIQSKVTENKKPTERKKRKLLSAEKSLGALEQTANWDDVDMKGADMMSSGW